MGGQLPTHPTLQNGDLAVAVFTQMHSSIARNRWSAAHVPPAPWLIPDVIARQWRSLSHGGLIPMQRYYFSVDLELVMHHAIKTELFARELQTVARALSGELSILQQFQNCCRHLFLRARRYNQAMF